MALNRYILRGGGSSGSGSLDNNYAYIITKLNFYDFYGTSAEVVAREARLLRPFVR